MSLMGKIFGTSPVRPMQHHMKQAAACARQIVPLFEAMAEGNREGIAERRREIDRLEHAADDIKNEIRSNLPGRLMMAIERRDILDILECQDSVADTAQDIAELADQRGMTIPGELREPLLRLAQSVAAACDQAERIINELDELVETGFKGREVERVKEMISELSRIETQTDELEERSTRELFALEEQLGIATMFWYQTIGWTADLADYAEKIGNRLRLLIAN